VPRQCWYVLGWGWRHGETACLSNFVVSSPRVVISMMDDDAKRRQDRLLDIMREHLARHMKTVPKCPICQTERWTVEPLVSHPLYTTDVRRPETPEQKALVDVY